jgi:thiol-disulfide isomerase/thioredoxin
MSIQLDTSKEFVEMVKKSHISVVKWGASFCGPCKVIQPFFDKLAQQYSDQAAFIRIEADKKEFEELAAAYRISALPTFHIFIDQKLVDSTTGANAKNLETFVGKYLNKQ